VLPGGVALQRECMGIEPPAKTPDNLPLRGTGGAESGALATTDSDLCRIIAAWPILPEPIRRAVLALVETTGPGSG